MDAKRVAPGVASPVLPADVLGRIHDLNLDYLELLVAEYGNPQSGGRQLPERVARGLVELSRQARQTLARVSFSLYSLGFEDPDFWRTALCGVEEPVTARYAPAGTAVRTGFCELALLHAWHLAVTRPIAARIVYGIPSELGERMARVKFWQLKRLAVDHPALLTPRWPSNPCFWPDMVTFARTGDLRRLGTVQQLGRQLMAVELQASAAPHSAIRLRQRNLLLQRLHTNDR